MNEHKGLKSLEKKRVGEKEKEVNQLKKKIGNNEEK